MISPVLSATPFAMRWVLRMIELRPLSAISVLLAIVGTGLVTGTSAKITPTGLAISRIFCCSSMCTVPEATSPRSVSSTAIEPNWILAVLWSALPSVVSATVSAASSGPRALIDVAMSSSSASTRSSGHDSNSAWAATAVATISSTIGSGASSASDSATRAEASRSRLAV